MSVSELEWEGMQLENAEHVVGGGHRNVDEELNIGLINVVGAFALMQV